MVLQSYNSEEQEPEGGPTPWDGKSRKMGQEKQENVEELFACSIIEPQS